MNKQEAQQVTKEAKQVGFKQSAIMRSHNNSYTVVLFDSQTGYSINIDSVEQWQEHKQAIQFSREHDA